MTPVGRSAPARAVTPMRCMGHSAEPSADGKTVFLAYWDNGFIALDVTDPTTPVLLGDTDYAPDEDGDAHSSSYDDARQLLFTADEDFCKNSGSQVERGLGICASMSSRTRPTPSRSASTDA